jgi:flagellar biosynthesis/type III secretory pathway chaperone
MASGVIASGVMANGALASGVITNGVINITVDTRALGDSINWLSTATPTQIAIALNAGIQSYKIILSGEGGGVGVGVNAGANTNAEPTRTLATATPSTALASTTPSTALASQTSKPQHNWETAEKSVERGKLAEQYIVDMLSERFGSDNITNTTKSSKCGDIEMTIDGARIVIEIKNYKTAITQKEVVKFNRDLSVRVPHGGLFISLGSPIVGVKGEFEIKYERVESRLIPCVYIVGSARTTIVAGILVLRQIIANKRALVGDLSSGEQLRAQLDRIMESTHALTRYRNDMSETMAAIQQMLCKNWQDITTAELAIKDATNAISTQYGDTVQFIGAGESILSSFTPQNRAETLEVFRMVNAINEKDSTWTVSNKKCVHDSSGIALLFSKTNAELAIPIERVSAEIIRSLIITWGKEFKITNSAVVLVIQQQYLERIGAVLGGK